MKFIIESGEDRGETRSLSRAKLIAGEWQLERERIVIITQTAPKRRRWKATLEPGGGVRLDVLFTDEFADDLPARARPKRRSKYALAYLPDVLFPHNPDLERARRVFAYARQWEEIERRSSRALDDVPTRQKTGGRKLRAVIEVATGRTFASIVDAANDADISIQSMFIRVRRPGSGWIYSDEEKMASARALPIAPQPIRPAAEFQISA